MPRILLIVPLAAALFGCTGPSYSIEGATLGKANQRAARYCAEREAQARLHGIERQNGHAVEVYRCVPPS
jgi:hypothetical protein